MRGDTGERERQAGRFSLGWLKRWIYRGDRPDATARLLNRFWADRYAAGGFLSRNRDVVLEVPGRSSGRVIEVPLVLTDLDGQWYAVSMLGAHANWVANVRAAQGRAVIRHGQPRAVQLEEVPVEQRPRILKRYLGLAPGARPHIPLDRRAPLTEFAEIAPDYPVFRIVRAD